MKEIADDKGDKSDGIYPVRRVENTEARSKCWSCALSTFLTKFSKDFFKKSQDWLEKNKTAFHRSWVFLCLNICIFFRQDMSKD